MAFLRGSIEGANCATCPLAVDGRPKVPVPGIGPEDPEWVVVGEGPGNVEVQWRAPLCLVPETLVLMADFTWKPLDDVQIGDRIWTVDEEAPRGSGFGASGRGSRYWRFATVTNKVERTAPTWEVITDQGVLRGTPDHRVMVGQRRFKSKATKYWRRIDELVAGKQRASTIAFVGHPWSTQTSFDAGWLSGFFDGEGCVDGSRRGISKFGTSRKKIRVQIGQNKGPTEERARQLLTDFNFKLEVHTEYRRTAAHVRMTIQGGLFEGLRFLGSIRPQRLLTNATRILADNPPAFRINCYGRVQRRQPTGLTERVIDITTTAGTFIANGFVVHNCGPTGQLLNRALKETGVDRNRLWLTNVTLCQPEKWHDETARAQAAACCRPRLNVELAQHPGKPLLLLGGVATREVVTTRLVKMTDLAGTYHEEDVDGSGIRPVVPTIHPAALLHAQGKGGSDGRMAMSFLSLKFDIQKVRAIAAGRNIRLELNLDYEVYDTRRASALVQAIALEIYAAKFLCLDLETYVDNEQRHSALQAFVAKIDLLGLSTHDRAICVKWDLLDARARNTFRALLANPRVTKTGHNNLTYDEAVLQNQHYGFTINGPREDCYVDSETEFLTEYGWKRYRDVKKGERLATIRADGVMEFQHFFHRVSRPYEGKALVFETQHTRAVVTPNHRMWCRPVRRTSSMWRGQPLGNWQFRRAEDMLAAETDSFEVLQTCRPSDGGDTPGWARQALLGLWISDGSYDARRDQILISQIVKGKASKLLRRLARTLGMHCSRSVKRELWRKRRIVEEVWRLDNVGGSCTVANQHLAREFVSTCGRYSRERHLPPDAMWWSCDAKRWFFEGLFSGDGSDRGGKQDRFVYRTGSRRLADGVQALALSIGWTAIRSAANVDDIYEVYILRKAPMTAQVRARISTAKASVREIEVDDRIVCFSVPNETLVTRSGSKPAFYGNTMLADHAAFPGMSHKLQNVACRFRGIRPWKSEYRDSEDTPEQAADYCATDTFATAKTLPAVHFWIKKHETERVYEVDRQKAMVAAQMHLRGEHIDPDVNEEIGRRLKIAIDASRQQILDKYESMKDRVLDRLAFEKAKTARKKDPQGSQHFVDRIAIRLDEIKKDLARVDKKTGEPNPKFVFSPSNDWHMIALLKAQSVPLIKTTDKGRVSTAAGILEDLGHIPEVAALLRYRSNEKLNGFNRRMFDWHLKSDGTWAAPYVQDDGRMHPIWSVNKLSGRNGSEDPNAQNWSQGDETNKDPTRQLPNLLRQRTAPPGRRIVGFDLEQLEARTMALQSDDPFLVKVFTEKRDIHAEFALLLFADFGSLVPKTSEYTAKRNITKRLEYGGLYGGADETVWKSIVVEFPEVTLGMTTAAIRTMKKAVGGVIRWQQRLFHQCSNPPYELRSYVLGRRRTFPMGDPSPTDVNNNPNQFTGADIMDIGLMNMLKRLPKYRGQVFMFANIHDAAYFECPDDDRIVLQLGRDIKESWTQIHRTPSGKEIEFPIELKHGYAMHDHIPGQEWDGCGRPGLQKLKL